METRTIVRNTTAQFLRSFSVLSDDSDFDELDEPDTADFLDSGISQGTTLAGPQEGDGSIRHTLTGGISFDGSKRWDQPGKIFLTFSLTTDFRLSQTRRVCIRRF